MTWEDVNVLIMNMLSENYWHIRPFNTLLEGYFVLGNERKNMWLNGRLHRLLHSCLHERRPTCDPLSPQVPIDWSWCLFVCAKQSWKHSPGSIVSVGCEIHSHQRRKCCLTVGHCVSNDNDATKQHVVHGVLRRKIDTQQGKKAGIGLLLWTPTFLFPSWLFRVQKTLTYGHQRFSSKMGNIIDNSLSCFTTYIFFT